MRYFCLAVARTSYFAAQLIWIAASLPLYGCEDSTSNTRSPAPLFVSDPVIEMDPNLNTPLAGVLKLATDSPVKVVLDISNGEKNRTIEFDDYRTDHTLPVLGLHPGKTHDVKVHIINRENRRSTFDKPLQIVTDPLPDGFPRMIVNKSEPDKMEPGYTLFDVIPEGINSEFGALIVITDAAGGVVWYQVGSRYTDVRQNAAGNLVFLQGSEYIEMDMLGNMIRKWKAMGKSREKISDLAVATPSFHHEVFPMENGNFLTLSIETRSFKNYPTNAWKPNSPAETAMVAGDVVVEFASDGSIVNEWALLDLIDPYRIGYDSLGKYWDTFFGISTKDWSHANSVIHDPRDDSVIVSIRHQDAVIKFDRKSGKLIWILSSHDNWDTRKFGGYLLKPRNGRQHFFPFHQHSPMILPNGNLMLYDNGNYRANPFDKVVPHAENFSRAIEYAIDEHNMTVELVWEHGQFTEKTVFSAALGNADYLPRTGNVLITHGNVYANKSSNKLSAQIIEVTHTTPAELLFDMTIFDGTDDPERGWRIYRSKRIASLYPQ